MKSVLWFRRDLRIEDNMALKAALSGDKPILCVFHFNLKQLSQKKSNNQSAFIKSVLHLKEVLKEKDIQLHLMFGEWDECFEDLSTKLDSWSDVYFNYDETGYGRKRDKKAIEFFKSKGIEIHTYQDHYLHGADEIKTKSNTFYKVFTPYFNNWYDRIKKNPIEIDLNKERFFELKEMPEINTINEYIGESTHKPGSEEAYRLLGHFVENNLEKYDVNRDFPYLDATSKLSPYLRSGEIGIRTVYHEISKAEFSKGQQTFIKELAWRDFYNMVYTQNLNQKEEAIQESFDNIRWENDEEYFEKWKNGETGFPIVDAAMRQLKETGWMHNRLRMIVASFLTKDLLIDWRWGEKYFEEMLIDYDKASNIGGWQWAASTGTDAVPYFRIFNPTTQSKKFDPKGEFIIKYIPELKNVDSNKIHEPSKMSKKDQIEVGCEIGKDYPRQIVNHSERRKLAIEIYEDAKAGN